MMFKTVACDYTSKFDLPCNGVVSLQVFVVQFNIRIIDVSKKPKDLSIVISPCYFTWRIDVFWRIDRCVSGHCFKISAICCKTNISTVHGCLTQMCIVPK